MAGLPLKSGADFYNLEAARMRLHNLGADPTEVGAGLIYFNTSTGLNTSQKARLYTGSAWKTIAFSEDLDVASNADFLALKDRVDLLSGDVDTDAIISNMKEVSAFLEGFAEDASLMDYLKTELGKKLDLTGGTIKGVVVLNGNGATNVPLNIATPSMGNTGYIRFGAGISANELGHLGFSAKGEPAMVYEGTVHPLLHSGNYSDYALPLTGGTITGDISTKSFWSGTDGSGLYIEGRSTVGVRIQYDKSGTGNDYDRLVLKNGVISWNNKPLLHSGNVGEYNAGSANILASSYNENINYESYTTHLKLIKSTSGDYVANGFPAQYVSGLSVMSGYTGWQMVTYGDPASDMRPYFRAVGGEGDWQAWKQLAFTDSNVASAQALIHSNGTVGATVGEAGNLCINKRISSADDSLNLFEYSAGFLYLGYSLRNEHTTRVYGNKIEFLTGDTQRMLINSSGNVTIGASDLAGTDAKLYVNGQTTLSSLTFSSANTISIDGNGNIKLSAKSGTYWNVATPNGINALTCYYNGNVLIGTTEDNGSGAKLQVNGTVQTNHIWSLSGLDITAHSEGDGSRLFLTTNVFRPWGDDAGKIDLGAPSVRWRILYTQHGDIADSLDVGGVAKFNKDVHISGNLIVDGEVSAGGAGTEGGNAGGGGAFHSESIAVGATQTTIAHGLGTDDIVVSIYEKDGVSGRWSIILTDVEIVDANNIIVSFGSATSVEHKVVIMGAVA